LTDVNGAPILVIEAVHEKKSIFSNLAPAIAGRSSLSPQAPTPGSNAFAIPLRIQNESMYVMNEEINE
jgi:hypothetical protein